MNLECSECKAMYWLNERRHSSSKSNPKFHTCCQGGAVKLEPIRDPPAELQELYTSTDPRAEQFRTNIRHYNGAFAFTSANYNADTRVTGYTPSFQIHGELYHLHGPLEPDDGVAPKFAQVWIHDPEYGNDVRCGRDPNLHSSTVELLSS